ncbi:hypothetical protein ACIQM4_17475 [Streptomyces sp. NPDC091272]|uniref:hypothetical protein n=1 Tax=Streptomyces sp. NPDC091272 TaxID=3365981 RepID=UPI003824A020
MTGRTMTVQVLTDLRLGTLQAAVSDWTTMHRKLETLATGGTGGGAGDPAGTSAEALRTKANAADWKGLNATVSRDFVTKTAAEFRDVAGEAKSVLGIMKDAHTSFTRHKADLATAIAELGKQGIYINGKGDALAPTPSPGAAGVGKDGKPNELPGVTQAELDEAARRIGKIVAEAAETDRIAARALRALAKDKYDFTGDGPGGLKEADDRQGKADADRWAQKIKEGNVKDWSLDELAAYNETLKQQRDNPGFTERFTTTLGAEGTLQFWRDLAAPPGGAVEGDRAKLLEGVQGNLSMSLANATQSDSPAMDTWKREMIAAGDKPFPIHGLPMGPNGFQVMGSLLGKGKFDEGFLHDYGKAVLEYERDFPGEPKSAWRDSTSLSYPPKDQPNDPVAGYLEALGHNPEASVEFFNDSTKVDGKEIDNWDYLVAKGDEARKWPEGDDGKPLGHAAMGHALESAAIGVPYDSDTTPPKHSVQSADLVNRLVGEYGKNPDRLDGSPLNASLGNITAEYMRDVQDGLSEKSIRTYGSNADLESLAEDNSLRNFLGAVGKDPDAYGAIVTSQQAVTTELVNDATHQRAQLGASLQAEVNNSVAPGSLITGIMADSRTQAVYDEKIASDAEFNKGIETADAWVGRAIETGLSRFPVAGDAAGWVIEDIRAAVLENYTRDSSAEAQTERGRFLSVQGAGSASAVHDATYTAAREAGLSHVQAEATAVNASEQSKTSYDQGLRKQ